uniref:NADH-ubiquinone oxidoreductase chain 4L n=1 Tax=Ophiognomonia clavigignenti-juglandacearum TaxID=218668 RepID=A0A2C9DSD8_9PEZI|nr:NADH dehydrogenase subunit 4L [Ophiognomonia clavigignenti-juglandacearum]
MNLTIILFLIGILGFVLNRRNIILMLISIEIMLLAITFLILVSSLNIDDIIGQTYAIYIIVVAGAESAIGLGILVAFYRLILSSTYFRSINCSYSLINSSFLSRNYSRVGPVPIYTSKRPCPMSLRYYSTYSQNLQPQPGITALNPNYLSGLIDAEGSFVVTTRPSFLLEEGF